MEIAEAESQTGEDSTAAAGRAAAREYDRDVKQFMESGQTEAKAGQAKHALDSPEAENLNQAEKTAKQRKQ